MNPNPKKTSIIGRLTRIIVPLALLAVGGVAWAYFHATAPRMSKKPPSISVPMVKITQIATSDTPAVINAMGTVTAAREVTLKARVSGEVIGLSPKFFPGGRILRGERILRLDPADYEVELNKAQSELKKAQGDLAIEQGSQNIAREEMRLLTETGGETVAPTDLALRKPQLNQAQAAVASAEADLRKARLDLKRTVIKAPFNALITACDVNLGSFVNSQESLVTIVDTDTYWVEAVIPVDQLQHLDLGQKGGCPAVIRSQGGGGTWQGRAIRTTGKLSQTSRMATVIITVSDPLGLKSNGQSDPLMLDDYVSVEITGRTLKSVVELDRSILRDGDTVWIFNDGKLEIRPVSLVWKQGERVFVGSGLTSDDKIIVSDLSAAVDGMQLMLFTKNPDPAQPLPAAEKAG